jgi:hypothetical protein
MPVRYIVSALVVLGALAYVVLRRGVTWRGVAIVAGSAATLALVGFEATRELDPADYPEVAEIEASLAGGTPTLVEFYRDN